MAAEVRKNPGARKGWLVMDGDGLVGWRRVVKEAKDLAKEYNKDPAAWTVAEIARLIATVGTYGADEQTSTKS